MVAVADMLTKLDQQKVLVVGLARSGIAAAKVLAKAGARVTGTDRQDSCAGSDELEALGVELALGGDRVDQLADTDLLVLSPGVPLSAALPEAARQQGIAVLGELEFAQRMITQQRPLPMIAVTGTNGKSTTAALSAHILRQSGRQVFLGGNIGLPLSELLLGDWAQTDLSVVEVSSFQLEHLASPKGFVPSVAIWMNLTPDHLDRHGDMLAYGQTKRRLFAGQGAADTCVFFADDDLVAQHLQGLAGTRRGFGRSEQELSPGGVLIEDRILRVLGGQTSLGLHNERLAGEHNAENAAAAVAATLAAGATLAEIQQGLDSYAGLPHRLEPVGQCGGVRFINDSKGTNVDATAKSLTSFAAPLLLIAGGRGKGTGYRKLRPLVSKHVRHLILIGEEADHLQRDLAGCAEIHRAVSMEAAVCQAHSLAAAGEVVLLSPACASFDMFRDYAHRGQSFAEAVGALEENP